MNSQTMSELNCELTSGKIIDSAEQSISSTEIKQVELLPNGSDIEINNSCMTMETEKNINVKLSIKKENVLIENETVVLENIEDESKNLLVNKDHSDVDNPGLEDNDLSVSDGIKVNEVVNEAQLTNETKEYALINSYSVSSEIECTESDGSKDLLTISTETLTKPETADDANLEIKYGEKRLENMDNIAKLTMINDLNSSVKSADLIMECSNGDILFENKELEDNSFVNNKATINTTKNNEEQLMECSTEPIITIKVENSISEEGTVNMEAISNDLNNVSSLQPKSIEQNIVIQCENIKQENPEKEVKKVKRKVHKKKKSGDHSTVISNGKVCGSDKVNNSLKQLMNYGSDSDSSDVEVIQDNSYRQPNLPFSEESENDSDSDLTSSSSSTSLFFSNLSDCVDSDEDDNCGAIKKTTNNNNNRHNLKTKGEMTLEDLPPVEDLKITVLEEDCLPVGKIFQIVDQLVVVQALKQTPTIDLDSVLFLEGGQPLGRVFDVFGPVTEPYYCVRFNSNQQIKDRNIAKNQTVYVAPKTEHTSYVFVSHLLQLKGSDASWKDNNEPPKHLLDYSDDEEERNARRSRQPATVKPTVVDVDEPVRKRPNAYEQRMNERNLRMNARAGVPRSMCRGRSLAHGRPFPKSEVIWPPAMSPSPQQSTMHKPSFTPDFFRNNSPFPPSLAGNYQFGNSPFPSPSPVSHQFANSPFRPINHQFGGSPLPPPSPISHQFGNSPLPPLSPAFRQFGCSFRPVGHQFGNPSLPPSPINHQLGSSSFQTQVNQHYGNSQIPTPPHNHQFGNSQMQPPMKFHFGNPQLPPSAKFQFGNSSLQQSSGNHFGKSKVGPVNQQYGNSSFPPPPMVNHRPPMVHHRPPPAPPMPQFTTGPTNTPPSHFPRQGPNPNQFWTQPPVFSLQRNNFKH